jgi:hypothetical protein
MPESNGPENLATGTEVGSALEIAKELTLFQVEQSLVLLADSAEEEGITPEIEQALIQYLEGAVEKRDRVAEFILFSKGMEKLAKAEVKRLRARQLRFKVLTERVSAMALFVLDYLRVTKLEGKTHTLKKRKCPPSVKIIEREKISAEYKHVTVTLALTQWEMLLASAPELIRDAVVSSIQKQDVSLDLESIKRALNLEKKVEGADLLVNKFTLQVS